MPDDTLRFQDSAAADEATKRHDRGEARVSLVGVEAKVTALKVAAPWLDWGTNTAGMDTLPLSEVLHIAGTWLKAPVALADATPVHQMVAGPECLLSRSWCLVLAQAELGIGELTWPQLRLLLGAAAA